MLQVFKPSKIDILEICPIYTDVCETLHYEFMLKIHYITDLLSYQFGTENLSSFYIGLLQRGWYISAPKCGKG